MHILHLLLDYITPKGSSSGLIDGVSLLHSLGNLNPVLVGTLVVSSASALDQGDNPVSLLEDPADPPVKCGFISNLHGKCELSDLKWVGFL